jgi:hypothetical protein
VGSGEWILDPGRFLPGQVLGNGYWILGIRYWGLDIGYLLMIVFGWYSEVPKSRGIFAALCGARIFGLKKIEKMRDEWPFAPHLQRD